MTFSPTIIVHGGAGWVPEESLPDRRQGCRRAAENGWKILAQGGTAVDAAVAAVEVLEDDPLFNAGIGSKLNRDSNDPGPGHGAGTAATQ